MGPSGRIRYILHILDCLGQVNLGFIQVLYLGRAPLTKETLPDFHEKCRVTGHSRVFRGLTGSQRTPEFRASHLSTGSSTQIQNLHIPVPNSAIYLIYPIYPIT